MVNIVYMYIVYPIPKLLYKYNDQKVALELDSALLGAFSVCTPWPSKVKALLILILHGSTNKLICEPQPPDVPSPFWRLDAQVMVIEAYPVLKYIFVPLVYFISIACASL